MASWVAGASSSATAPVSTLSVCGGSTRSVSDPSHRPEGPRGRPSCLHRVHHHHAHDLLDGRPESQHHRVEVRTRPNDGAYGAHGRCRHSTPCLLHLQQETEPSTAKPSVALPRRPPPVRRVACQHPVAAPVLFASSPSTLTKYILDINNNHVAAVPQAMSVKFPAVTAPTISTPTTQWQQLYNGSEFFMTISSQCITTKAHVHRPMPWPSFVVSSHASSKPRPLPWPSYVVPPGDVHLTEPRPPLQGTSEKYPVVVRVLYQFLGSLSWISLLHICLQCELDREENVTSVRRIFDQEEQYISLGMSLNISEKI